MTMQFPEQENTWGKVPQPSSPRCVHQTPAFPLQNGHLGTKRNSRNRTKPRKNSQSNACNLPQLPKSPSAIWLCSVRVISESGLRSVTQPSRTLIHKVIVTVLLVKNVVDKKIHLQNHMWEFLHINRWEKCYEKTHGQMCCANNKRKVRSLLPPLAFTKAEVLRWVCCSWVSFFWLGARCKLRIQVGSWYLKTTLTETASTLQNGNTRWQLGEEGWVFLALFLVAPLQDRLYKSLCDVVRWSVCPWQDPRPPNFCLGEARRDTMLANISSFF